MHRDSSLAQSQPVEAPDSRGTGAHNKEDDAIRTAESPEMLSLLIANVRSEKCGGLDSGGFTLLELIVAIAITAIIVVIVAGAMRLGIKSVDRGEKRIDALERIRTSINIIEAQVQSMTGLTYDDNGEKKRYFKAARDSMQFSTNYSIWGGQKGYAVVSYTVETGSDGKQTMKASENVVGVENAREASLLGSYDKIYFEYFYKGPTDEKGSWTEEWTDDINIPEKIKLHLVSGQNDFALIIPIRIAQYLNSNPATPASKE